MKFDLLFWSAGTLWGNRIMELLARRSRRAAALTGHAEHRRPRLAALAVLLAAFLPVPSPLIYAAAGWAGLRLLPFIILDLIGSAVWAALLAVLGYLLGTSGVAAANLMSHYALASIAVLTAIAIAPQAWHALRPCRSPRATSSAHARAHGDAFVALPLSGDPLTRAGFLPASGLAGEADSEYTPAGATAQIGPLGQPQHALVIAGCYPALPLLEAPFGVLNPPV
jgi:hypothetical protein